MLAFLMGIGERAATVQEITRATGYSGVTIRDAARDLMLARFIRETNEHPLRYYARRAQWTTLLDPGISGKPPDMLHWDFWKDTFAFLTHVNELVRSCTAESASEYVLCGEFPGARCFPESPKRFHRQQSQCARSRGLSGRCLSYGISMRRTGSHGLC